MLEESPAKVRFQADFVIPQPVVSADESGKMTFTVQQLNATEEGFDFSDEMAYMISRDAFPLLADDWTVELEFKANRTAGRQTLISLFGEGKDRHALLLELDDRRGVRLLFRNPPGNQGGTALYSDCPVTAGQWHKLLCRYTSGLLTVELNGQTVASGQAGSPVADPMFVLFGRLYRENNQRAFDGLIRNVRLQRKGSMGYVMPMEALGRSSRLHLRETVTLEKGRVTVEDEVLEGHIRAMTIHYPFVIHLSLIHI